MLVAGGAPPGLAALDVRNITLVRMEHGLAPMRKKLLDPGPPPILARGGEMRLALEGICTDATLLREALKSLHSRVRTLETLEGE